MFMYWSYNVDQSNSWDDYNDNIDNNDSNDNNDNNDNNGNNGNNDSPLITAGGTSSIQISLPTLYSSVKLPIWRQRCYHFKKNSFLLINTRTIVIWTDFVYNHYDCLYISIVCALSITG
jgi:hypothetical protein